MKTLAAALLGVTMAAPAFAQAPAPRAGDPRQTHYQIGVMERVLEGAVEHGAANFRDRLQAVFPDAPAQLMILDNPRVRGFRLDGYGVFFDVEVPSSNGTLLWSLRTLDQSGPAAAPASPTVPASTVAPVLPNRRRPNGAGAAANPPSPPDRSVSAASLAPRPAQNDDTLLNSPNEAYRAEVVQAIADAMLDYSAPLAVGPDEWLTVAARGIQDRPRIASPDNDGQTVVIRIKGSDLQSFRAGQISRDEVLKRIENEKRMF
ncbi:MAG TPA: hypothetical protein VN628_04730 [Vicinamibacterales bacterium]|nr:hypothetical protein [Vicinamibacterales bacterium]